MERPDSLERLVAIMDRLREPGGCPWDREQDWASLRAYLVEESFEAGLLEYPHYTRPRDWEGLTIPEVLLSGDHKRIARWRRAEAERLTRERRPGLWARYKGKRTPS